MPGSTVLIVEDSPLRMRSFRQKLIGNTVDIVTPAQEAIDRLRTNTYDWVFLDFDLDQHGAVDPGNGGDVVAWIVRNPSLFDDTRFVVHSLNTVGGMSMYRLLRRLGLRARYLPGVWENEPFLETV